MVKASSRGSGSRRGSVAIVSESASVVEALMRIQVNNGWCIYFPVAARGYDWPEDGTSRG
jgi:hypothetical protein